jgi:hypothetical protein
MILLLSVNEADCLDHQHRRARAAAKHHWRDRIAYRASGLVPRLISVDRVHEPSGSNVERLPLSRRKRDRRLNFRLVGLDMMNVQLPCWTPVRCR